MLPEKEGKEVSQEMKIALSLVKLVAVCLVILLWLEHRTVVAQVKVVKPRNSEENSWILDSVDSHATKDTVLIIIGFLGTEDTKKRVLRRRLHTVSAYFIDVHKKRNRSNLVVAASIEKDKYKYGGIEIYVNGELAEILTAYKNEDLNVGPFALPDDEDKEADRIRKLLYPWRY